LIATFSASYELGFAAEVGWKARTNRDEFPPFSYVEELLLQRIDTIMRECQADEASFYLSKGKSFRHAIAKQKPYKGTRIPNKPFHFHNIGAYLQGQLGAEVVTFLEADDALAVAHTSNNGQSIIASRDKDLRMVPGLSYSWELGKQPRWGPEVITKEGSLTLDRVGSQPKLKGTGLSWFYAQLLMGDTVDNIGGCGGIGPVAAFNLLTDKGSEEQLEAVKEEYKKRYGDEWEKVMTEMGQLVWIVRELDRHHQPVMWQPGMGH
jgi:hypothetical protein